jgi:hypothetical protein
VVGPDQVTHALVDALGNPIGFFLTGGEAQGQAIGRSRGGLSTKILASFFGRRRYAGGRAQWYCRSRDLPERFGDGTKVDHEAQDIVALGFSARIGARREATQNMFAVRPACS